MCIFMVLKLFAKLGQIQTVRFNNVAIFLSFSKDIQNLNQEETNNQGSIGELDKYQQIPAIYFEQLSYDELMKNLTRFIFDLLQHDFHRLCNLIYRHDVDESKFNQALQLNDIEAQAKAIAALVVDREMQKVASRKAYREHKLRNENKISEGED